MTAPFRAGDGGYWCAHCPTHADDRAELDAHLIEAHPGTGLSTSARLAFTEQRLAETGRERDALVADNQELTGDRDELTNKSLALKAELAAEHREVARLRIRVVEVCQERDEAHVARDALAELYATVCSQKTEIAAELVSARQEIEQLRAAQSWIVARDGGRYCERCEQEVRSGEAYELEPGTGGLVAHIRCPDLPLPDNQNGAPTA